MKENNNLARHLAVAAAIAALCGTSAFADVRHREETQRGGGGSDRGARVERSNHDNGAAQRQVEQQRATRTENWDRNRSQQQTFDRNNRDNRSSNWNRNESRSTATEWRNNNRSNDWNRNNNRSNDWNRNNNRNNNWNRNNNYYRGGHAPSFYNGRISRYERWNGGFRVYIGGAPYPFFVPEAYFISHGWRAGLSIRIGGYYNPLGYYDYYDGPYYDSVATAGALRGVVESVDYRRGTVVVRDDISGDFVSTVMRGRDRTFDQLRPGDYIELRGDWVRGVFEAYQADLLGDRYYR